jgi:hypothetical protein
MRPLETLTAFDHFLAESGLFLDAVIVGGTALNLMGVISRPTRDCDVLYPALSAELRAVAASFAKQIRAMGRALDDNWLNDTAAPVAHTLPPGWKERLHEIFRGRAITLRSLGRTEILMTKLYALCDRGMDLPDCVALAPTRTEMDQITPWLRQQDLHPDWPGHVERTLDHLRRSLTDAT